MSIVEETKLRMKFLKDTKLPISVHEDPYFGYFLDLYEEPLNARTLYNEFLNNVNSVGLELYNGAYRELVDSVIAEVESNIDYSKLTSFDTNYDRSVLKKMEVRKDLYSNLNIEKRWISIDLSKANFSAFKTISSSLVKDKKSYEEWISSFPNGDLFKTSKSVRQVIFGNLNPKRQQVLQSMYMTKFLEELDKSFDLEGRLILTMGADEVIFELDEDLELVIVEEIEKFNNDTSHSFNLKKEVFDLDKLSEFKEFGYLKTYLNGKKEILGVSKNFYAQAYKYLLGKEVEENDLYFYYEGILSKMTVPIERKGV